jgi:uncharacterized protein (DUF362 family)/NAD-dependent dihydropyrimidine dehydrogenase PreA subunit
MSGDMEASGQDNSRSRDVALLGCESYDRDLVEQRVGRAFELMGGPGAIASTGESVFVKVNALLPSAPEKAVTTHPEVVRAVVLQFKQVTDRIIIGDSPGGPYSPGILKRFYNKCGFAQVAEDTGAELNYDTSVEQVTLPDGKMMKAFTICSAMKNADHLVSVSKFKTHMFMNITAAIKNMFGAVAGMNKFTYHSRFSRPEDFADMLVDVALVSSADFHVVDSVVGMDGDGPSAGNPKPMGFIAAGTDPFTLDLQLMELIGTDPRVNKPLAAAIDRALCLSTTAGLKVLGDDPGALAVQGFQLPAKKDISMRVPGFLMDRFGAMVSLRPRPSPDRCTGCRKCADVCPAKAITMVNSVAKVDTGKCIKCYCCHELCEYDAIDLHRPVMLRLMGIKTG